jgi:GNAT superfamily N-acetyltransferase
MPNTGSPAWIIERCSTIEILPLRRSVLRDATPSQDPRYAEDDQDGTVHIAVRDYDNDGEVIATSTWLPRPWLDDELAVAVQLRGMAVAKHVQGRGLGGVVLGAGINHARTLGAQYVWARARDSALYFYEHHGFTRVGDGFTDESTGLGHHLVVQSVTRNDV